jgi:hypothetical protein
MNLLIHADPGARSGFLAACLTDKLTRLSFDSGIELHPTYVKIHRLEHAHQLVLFDGIKIRIRPSINCIDLISLLFLKKNVHSQILTFTRNEYSLETFTKLMIFSKEILTWDSELDYSLYDHVVNFKDTFDTEFMKNFYTTITGNTINQSTIDVLEQTNLINKIEIDKNHACSIVKLILARESELGLEEQNRFWSIVDTYNTVATEQLYDTVLSLIDPKNYGTLLK